MRASWVVGSAILLGCTGGAPSETPATVSLSKPGAETTALRPAAELPPPDLCSGGKIASTDLCDTPENREVLGVCEAYRSAVEARDVEGLLALASADYYEDGGTAEESDDHRRADLEAYLRGQFASVDQVRYEVRYRKIRPGPTIRVDVTYSASFRIGTEWKRDVNDNVIELRREQGKLLIVGGM